MTDFSNNDARVAPRRGSATEEEVLEWKRTQAVLLLAEEEAEVQTEAKVPMAVVAGPVFLRPQDEEEE
jgi:hypothetical protein